jgi:hypothetical protein
MSKTLTFNEAFSVLEGMETVFKQKTNGKLAIKLYKITRPLKSLVEDYKELISKVDGEENSNTWSKNVADINNSPFAEFETLTLDELESLELTPQCLVLIESIIEQ